MEDKERRLFSTDLISWYNENKRDLPWRTNTDPYRIWVSEIMLQQTQVTTVIPYYLKFMEKFPTVFALAKADLEEIYKTWEGLGYYSRARNMHETAQVITEKYAGEFPKQYEDILKLKGIGSYTAGALASIAFNEATPAVDGNVMRVLSRIFSIFDDVALAKTKKQFETAVSGLIPPTKPGLFNQALMELGALVCKPKGQKCRECPVAAYCTAYINGYDDELPVKSTKAKQKSILLITGIIENQNREYLMRKRPEEGLLSGLWEFVQTEGHDFRDLALYLDDHYGMNVNAPVELDIIRHVFTHRIWVMTVYHAKTNYFAVLPPFLKWMTKEDILSVPVSTAHKKVYELLK